MQILIADDLLSRKILQVPTTKMRPPRFRRIFKLAKTMRFKNRWRIGNWILAITLCRGVPEPAMSRLWKTVMPEPYLRKGAFQPRFRCRACSMIYAETVPAEFATGSFYDDAGDEYLAADKLSSDYAGGAIRTRNCVCSENFVREEACSMWRLFLGRFFAWS